MIRVGLVGAIGYGGRELIRLIGLHPEAKLVAAAELEGGKRIEELLPAFGKTTDVVCETFDAKRLAETCDAVFIAVPGTKSMELGKALYEAGVRTLDMGADFRLKDMGDFETFYKAKHTCPEVVREAVYGFVPYHRDAIRDANSWPCRGAIPSAALRP